MSVLSYRYHDFCLCCLPAFKCYVSCLWEFSGHMMMLSNVFHIENKFNGWVKNNFLLLNLTIAEWSLCCNIFFIQSITEHSSAISMKVMSILMGKYFLVSMIALYVDNSSLWYTCITFMNTWKLTNQVRSTSGYLSFRVKRQAWKGKV